MYNQWRTILTLTLLLSSHPNLRKMHVTATGSLHIIESVLQDNLVFLRDQGIFVEPSSLAYTYSTFVYERIHLVIPDNLEVDHQLPGCTDDQNEAVRLEKSILMSTFRDSIRERIKPYTSPLIKDLPNRPKRAAVALAAITAASIISIGISVFNTVQIKEVARQTSRLTDEINRISQATKMTTNAVNKVISEFNNLSTVIIPKIAEQINTVVFELHCLDSKGQYFRELHRRLLQDIYINVVSGINALYNGKITPDFYPISVIQSTLLNRPDMINSMYAEDVNLVYRLGNFITLSVTHEPFSVSGILILPKLLKEHIGIVLSVNKVPITIPSQSDPVIMDCADLAVKDVVTQRVWTPNFDACIKNIGTYYCPLHEIRARYSKCLTGLIFNHNTTECKFVDAEGYPKIKQATAGILVSDSIKEYVNIVKDADGHRKSIRLDFDYQNSSNFLTIMDGEEVMIDHDMYLLSPETAEITLQINGTITYPDFDIGNISIPSFQPIPLIPEFIPHYITQGLSISTSMITLVLSAIIGYMFWKIRKLQNNMAHVLRTIQHDHYLLSK